MYDGMDSGKITCQYDDTLFSMQTATAGAAQLEDLPALETSIGPSAVRLLERVSIQNTVDFFSKKGGI